MRRRSLLTALLLVAATACGTTPEAAPIVTTTSPAAAEGPQLPELAPEEDFYTVPADLPGGEPGRLIRVQEVDAPDGVAGWRILYHSRSVSGADVAVSGLLFAPDEPASEPRPVVAWGHGSVGLGDECAPSRLPDISTDAPIFTDLLKKGFVITATDYEGLGTPGPHPWLVGMSEGRNMIDSVRAAANLRQAGAGDRYIALGVSQGGGAALFAGELASSYGSGLELLGVVAEAPAAELDLVALAPLIPTMDIAGIGGFVAMGALGFKAAYPDLPLEAVLKPEIVAQKDTLEQLCQTQIDIKFHNLQLSGVLTGALGANPSWAAAIAQNTPGATPTSAPVLLVHGTADQVVPAEISQLLLQRLCGLGVDAQRIIFEGATHVDVFQISSEIVSSWIADRAAGRPATSEAVAGAQRC